MSIDYDRLRGLVAEMEQGVAATTRYTWLDLAREVLRLHDGIEVIRDYCTGGAAVCRSSNDPDAPVTARELEAVDRTLADLLEGDNK